jgi:hypothetical protein
LACVDLAHTVFGLASWLGTTTPQRDIFGVPLFGKTNFDFNCSTLDTFERTLRRLLLRAGDAEPGECRSTVVDHGRVLSRPRCTDAESSLRFCMFDTDVIKHGMTNWANNAVNSSCASDHSCLTNPVTVEGLTETTRNSLRACR